MGGWTLFLGEKEERHVGGVVVFLGNQLRQCGGGGTAGGFGLSTLHLGLRGEPGEKTMPGEIPMSSLEEIITHRIAAPVDSSPGDEGSHLVGYAIHRRGNDPGHCCPVSSLVEPFSHCKEDRVSPVRAS